MKEKHIFKLKPGQIDYTHKKIAPVINCIVKYNDKILILKRSKKLRFYPNVWNGVSGFLDDDKSIIEKAKEELKEEINVASKHIKQIIQAKQIIVNDPKTKKWLITPVLVIITTNKIKTNWETQKYKWIKPEEIKKYKTTPKFPKIIAQALSINVKMLK